MNKTTSKLGNVKHAIDKIVPANLAKLHHVKQVGAPRIHKDSTIADNTGK